MVGRAGDGRTAVEQAVAVQLDLVPMDVRMPVMDGLEATCRILSTAHGGAASTGTGRPRVLVLITFDVDDYVYVYVYEALCAGPAGSC